jgi:predicted FMN-binding regulatory protein PaiB
VQSIDGVSKLNQTHPVGDQHRVIQQLLLRDAEGDVAIASLMAQRLAG